MRRRALYLLTTGASRTLGKCLPRCAMRRPKTIKTGHNSPYPAHQTRHRSFRGQILRTRTRAGQDRGSFITGQQDVSTALTDFQHDASAGLRIRSKQTTMHLNRAHHAPSRSRRSDAAHRRCPTAHHRHRKRPIAVTAGTERIGPRLRAQQWPDFAGAYPYAQYSTVPDFAYG